MAQLRPVPQPDFSKRKNHNILRSKDKSSDPICLARSFKHGSPSDRVSVRAKDSETSYRCQSQVGLTSLRLRRLFVRSCIHAAALAHFNGSGAERDLHLSAACSASLNTIVTVVYEDDKDRKDVLSWKLLAQRFPLLWTWMEGDRGTEVIRLGSSLLHSGFWATSLRYPNLVPNNYQLEVRVFEFYHVHRLDPWYIKYSDLDEWSISTMCRLTRRQAVDSCMARFIDIFSACRSHVCSNEGGAASLRNGWGSYYPLIRMPRPCDPQGPYAGKLYKGTTPVGGEHTMHAVEKSRSRIDESIGTARPIINRRIRDTYSTRQSHWMACDVVGTKTSAPDGRTGEDTLPICHVESVDHLYGRRFLQAWKLTSGSAKEWRSIRCLDQRTLSKYLMKHGRLAQHLAPSISLCSSLSRAISRHEHLPFRSAQHVMPARSRRNNCENRKLLEEHLALPQPSKDLDAVGDVDFRLESDALEITQKTDWVSCSRLSVWPIEHLDPKDESPYQNPSTQVDAIFPKFVYPGAIIRWPWKVLYLHDEGIDYDLYSVENLMSPDKLWVARKYHSEVRVGDKIPLGRRFGRFHQHCVSSFSCDGCTWFFSTVSTSETRSRLLTGRKPKEAKFSSRPSTAAASRENSMSDELGAEHSLPFCADHAISTSIKLTSLSATFWSNAPINVRSGMTREDCSSEPQIPELQTRQNSRSNKQKKRRQGSAWHQNRLKRKLMAALPMLTSDLSPTVSMKCYTIPEEDSHPVMGTSEVLGLKDVAQRRLERIKDQRAVIHSQSRTILRLETQQARIVEELQSEQKQLVRLQKVTEAERATLIADQQRRTNSQDQLIADLRARLASYENFAYPSREGLGYHSGDGYQTFYNDAGFNPYVTNSSVNQNYSQPWSLYGAGHFPPVMSRQDWR